MEKEQNEIQALSPRILAKAAHKIGGVGALARFLDVGDGTLGDWLAGRLVPPVEVILKATSLLVDEPTALWRSPQTGSRRVDSSGPD